MMEKELISLLKSALPDSCPAEIVAETGSELRARFSSSAVQFQTVEEKNRICVRLWRQNRPLIFVTNTLADLPRVVAQAVEQADENIAVQLPSASRYKEMSLWDDSTAQAAPGDLEEEIVPILRLSGQTGLPVIGRFSVQRRTLAVVNSAGVAASCRATWAGYRAQFTTPDGRGSGLAIASGRSLSALNPLAASLEATARCHAGINMRTVQPAAYTVIMEPAATAQLVNLLAGAFSGEALLAGETPFVEPGTPCLGENISIWDDGLDQQGMAMPFDFQGVPKRRLSLVRDGVLQNHAWDSETAVRRETESTGHAAHPTASLGPIPSHLYLEAGNAMLDDMIVSTRRGILVSRLYKPQVLDRASMLISGQTGWGTLLIEEGKITGAVAGLDFVANLVQAFNNVEMIGDKRRMSGTIWASTTAPALKIRDFELSGSEGGRMQEG